MLRLALLVGGCHLDLVGVLRDVDNRHVIRWFQLKINVKRAVGCGNAFACRNRLIVDVIRHPIPETEREICLSDDFVFVCNVVETEARECRHFARNCNAVADFVFVFRRFESHLEGWTLVFFNLHKCRVMLADNIKITVDSVGRDGETAA